MTKMNEEALRDALKVYFIMGSENCKNNPVEVLRNAITGGITTFQFREKGRDAREGEEKFTLAKELQALCKKAGIPFIVNDDIDLALAIHADGVHIGQEDEQAESVRKKIGDKILGVSVHNIAEAEQALKAGADYFGVGPIFPTTSKETTNPVQGVEIIQTLRAAGFSVPIVGIGGINSENAESVIKAGADGVSVISAISHADNIIKATQKLTDAVVTGSAL